MFQWWVPIHRLALAVLLVVGAKLRLVRPTVGLFTVGHDRARSQAPLY